MRTVVTMLLVCAAAAGQELPDAPSFSRTNQPRTADRAFWITTGVYGASVAGDAITQALEAAALNPDVPEFKVGVLQT